MSIKVTDRHVNVYPREDNSFSRGEKVRMRGLSPDPTLSRGERGGGVVATAPLSNMSAVRLAASDTISELVDDFLSVGDFRVNRRDVLERAFFDASTKHPEFSARVRELIGEIEKTPPSAKRRLEVMEFFLEYGMPYVVRGNGILRVRAKTNEAAMAKVQAEIDLTKRFMVERDGLASGKVTKEMIIAADEGKVPVDVLFKFIETQDEKLLNVILYSSKNPAHSQEKEEFDILPLSYGETYALSGHPEDELIKMVTEENPNGSVVSIRRNEFDTDVHFPVTAATPITNGYLDPIPKNQKVVAIHLHGSGRENSSGGSAAELMKALAAHGVASFAPDLPEHANGPDGFSYGDPKKFADWLDVQVRAVKENNPNAKIILTGSCSGSLLALMYLAYHKGSVDSAILFGLGGRFIDDVERQVPTMISAMTGESRDGGDVAAVTNTRGLLWIDTLAKQFDIFGSERPDIPIRLVLGEKDVIYPAGSMDRIIHELAAHYGEKFSASVVGGIGHAIWEHKVSDVRRLERETLFAERPENDSTNLVDQLTIDWLRNGLALSDDVSVLPNREVLHKLSNIQMAMLLYEQNPAFRSFVALRSVISTEEKAGDAISRWQDIKAIVLDKIIVKAIETDPDFKRAHRGEINAYIVALKSGHGVERKRRSLADALLKHFASSAEDRRAPRNYWDPTLLLRGIEAQLAYQLDEISDETSGPKLRAVKPGGRLERVMTWAKELWRLMNGEKEAHRHNHEWNDGRLEFLKEARYKVGISASMILAIANGHDLMLPYGMLRDVKRAVVLSELPFGSPEEVARLFNSREMMLAHRYSADAAGYSTDGAFKNKTSGGDFINRIMTGLGARKILAVHYFAIDEAGQKTYLDCDPASADKATFRNAEVRFISSEDGEERTLEVVNSNFVAPERNVQTYLSEQPVNAVFAGHDATEFETQPKGLRFYYNLLRQKNIPWVSLDRRRAITGATRRMTLHNLTHAYLNKRTVTTHAFYNNLSNICPFPEGSNVHVARHTDFKNQWNGTDTIAWYEELMLDRRNFFVVAMPILNFEIFPGGLPHTLEMGASTMIGTAMPMMPMPMMPI